MVINTLIIEDEEQSISALKAEIEAHCKNIKITGIAKSVNEAIKKIHEQNPDLIFLDIQLSDGLGFDILKEFDDKNFKIIFTTAYSEYALKAIKFSALDYLLKPIDSKELIQAVEKVVQSSKMIEKTKLETFIRNQNEGNPRKRIALQTNDSITVYETDTILRCSAEGNYTCVYFVNGKKGLFSKTLKEFEDLLCNSSFERIHHSHIINLTHLISFINKEGGYVLLSDKSTIPVSQRKKTQLIATLNNYNL